MVGSVARSADLDSHFRYLSGLLLGDGLAFAWCALAIERRATIFRTLSFIVVAGGVARLIGALHSGMPGAAHRFALVMELLVVPLLLIWLRGIELNGSDVRAPQASVH